MKHRCGVTITRVSAGRGLSEYRFDLSGGDLSLDFANTVSRRSLPERRAEHLNSYDDLVAFGKQSSVLSWQEAARLRKRARRHQREASRNLRDALQFREVLYHAFAARAARRQVSVADLKKINDRAVEAMTRRALGHSNGGYRWNWLSENADALERPLWHIAQAAADLLTSDGSAEVRQCDAPDCAWLFLDRSRNRSRRWCDMKTCGNREKARRHYQREHEEETP